MTKARDAIHATAEDPMKSLEYLKDDHEMEAFIAQFESICSSAFSKLPYLGNKEKYTTSCCIDAGKDFGEESPFLANQNSSCTISLRGF